MRRKNVLDDGENTPEENYAWLQENHMNNFKDFKIWYNNRDIAPFVSAVKKLFHFYKNIGIDVFKVAISAPGIARRILFDTATEAGAYFTLFDEYNRDFYETQGDHPLFSIVITRLTSVSFAEQNKHV